jgi:hypothetical protein
MELINPITFTDSMLTSTTAIDTATTLWTATPAVNINDYYRLDTTHLIYQCLIAHQGASASSNPAVTMTIAIPCVVTWNAHGLLAGTEIIFATTGALPTGIIAGTKYYVTAPATNTFNLATTYGGSALTTTGSQSGTHTATVNSTSPDVNLTGVSPKWLLVGATNSRAMFDDKFGTQTIDNLSLTTQVTPNLIIDSIALLNMKGKVVTVTSTVGGVTKFTQTIKLQTDVGVYDWSTYFLAPIVAEDDVIVTGLPPYVGQVLTINITGSGSVAIGNVAMGGLVSLGLLEYNPTIGIIDYSVKTTDQFGNVVVTKRAYSKRFGGSFIVENDQVDSVASILASVRSTPVVWLGLGSTYASLIVWGFFKDFEITLAETTYSHCAITIEGLV